MGKIKRPLWPRIMRQLRLVIWPNARDIEAIEREREEDFWAENERIG